MQLPKYLHIICLNVPYPVNYGGVFDLFYKLVALYNKGIKIYLHCFEYGRGQQSELNKYCEKVYYYQRKKWWQSLSFITPFIVKSRSNNELAERLLQDNYPVLMEGVHCTYLLNDRRFNDRKCCVRLHNVEYIYYHHLYKNSKSPAKKIYFLLESWLLKAYEKRIAKQAAFFAVTEKDAETYKTFGAGEALFLPVFLPEWQITPPEGKGTFCLYHGDLSIAENEHAATWLLTSVFDNLEIPFVIAGKNPPEHLRKRIESKNTACLIANPSEKDMQDLISKAQINIIPSYNNTGIKLKLINALFNGRHCIVNRATVQGSGLDEACHIAETATDFRHTINNLFKMDYNAGEVMLRKKLLEHTYDNQQNASRLIQMIWKDDKAGYV